MAGLSDGWFDAGGLKTNSGSVIMEIRAEPMQRVVAGSVALILVGAAAGGVYGLFYPNSFAAPNGAQPVATTLVGGAFLVMFSFWFWWSTVRYHAYVTEQGVGQTDGFRRKFVEWPQVDGYTMERVRRTRERLVEPVLRDARLNVLLRPTVPLIVHTQRGREARAAFWRYVVETIEAARLG